MKLCTQITLVVLAVLAGLGYKVYHDLSVPLPMPALDKDAYWGPGLKSDHKPSTLIQPFTIQYANAVGKPIEALRSTLNRSLLLPAPLEGVGFEYGVNSDALPEIVRAWRDDYLPRWGEREKFLNQFPQFITQIQGLNVHFIHVKPTAKQSAGKTVVPLLLIHGWPGSVREFYEIIPKLTAATGEHDVVFEVIAPSLPGYGFSQAASKTGFGPIEMSVVLRNLMIRLGHTRFFIQGGDWGSILGSHIATIFPENVIGYHTNMCFGNGLLGHIKGAIASLRPTAFVAAEHVDFHFPGGAKFVYMLIESGYMHLQATKPDTIGTVLSQNPVGLLAYIVEKFSTWTNGGYRALSDGGWSKFSANYRDAILDNIMIYYLTNSITTSQRLYSEAFTFQQLGYQIDRVQTGVPYGCARFKHDLAHSLDWQLSDKYTNIVTSTYHPDGGHFAAMEKAQLLFEDFSKFVKKVRGL